MTRLLIRLFIRDAGNVVSSKVRGSYIRLGGFAGIVCNFLLFAAKLAAGIFSGSVSIFADAFNNLSDMGSAIVTLLGFKMASKPADRQHPFGHGRMEYMSGFIVACVIIVMGAELLSTSVGRVLHPGEIRLGPLVFIILLASVLLKLWLGLFSRKLGQLIQSTALTATAADNLLDVLATCAVLAAAVVSQLSGLPLDGWVGALVSMFIVYSGVRIARETLNPLLGEAPGRDTVSQLEQLVLSYEGIIGVHDIVIHSYGPGKCFACLHVEVPSDADMMETHELIDRCEREVRKKMGFELVIHMDPVDIENTLSHKTRQMTEEALAAIDPGLRLHDFRMVEAGEALTLFFDVAVPDRLTADDAGLIERINNEVGARVPGSSCVVMIDRHYQE